MKNFKYLLLFFMAILFTWSCNDDDLDLDALTDFPPGIISVTPPGLVKAGTDFDIIAVFVDGVNSPLASGSLTLLDSTGTEVGSVASALSGQEDSLVLAGSVIGASTLPLGNYTLQISATDTKGQSVAESRLLVVSTQLFNSNHDEMFIAGAFNGWGADPMTLVDHNTWEITADVLGDAWKIKNCVDWCDEDWGDGDCNGQMESNMDPGGNGNTECGFSGLSVIRFNDATKVYSVTSALTFESNVETLYLQGTFNNFQGGDHEFNLVDDNTWRIEEVLIDSDDQIRFAELPDGMAREWGDNDNDGIAEEFGAAIRVGSTLEGKDRLAFYNLEFNDQTLAYKVEFNFFPSVGIIGSATPGGWDSDTDMEDNGDGTYFLGIDLIVGEVKFRENDSWDVNWGGNTFPTGDAVPNSSDNIPIDTAGYYEITLDRNNLTYSFVRAQKIQSVALIGDATPNGWDDPDFDMRDLGNGDYGIIIGLVDGTVKFRANDGWDINWGGTDFPTGTGVNNGPDNIPVTAGIYEVRFNVETAAYSFTPATIGIIGDATPGGWDNDTDMTPTGTTGEVSLNMTLNGGNAKFRAQDDWTFNWGSAAFPMGTGVQDSPDNIPVTAGTYTITFNVNTREYNFQ